MQGIKYYVSIFSSLHTNKQKGIKAPHKAVLLMAVIDLVEDGGVCSPHIVLTKELEECFNATWRRYIGNSALFSPDIAKPFYHMQHEDFWMLVTREEANSSVAAEDDDTIINKKTLKDLPYGRYSVNAMRDAFAYAEMDRQLFDILQNNDARAVLRVTLINNYFTNHPTKSMPSLTSFILALPLMTLVA